MRMARRALAQNYTKLSEVSDDVDELAPAVSKDAAADVQKTPLCPPMRAKYECTDMVNTIAISSDNLYLIATTGSAVEALWDLKTGASSGAAIKGSTEVLPFVPASWSAIQQHTQVIAKETHVPTIPGLRLTVAFACTRLSRVLLIPSTRTSCCPISSRTRCAPRSRLSPKWITRSPFSPFHPAESFWDAPT